MNTILLAAAIASLAVCALHFFLGGPAIAGPLLHAKDMNDVAKFTNYYCWHLVTLMLATMAAGFAWAAIDPNAIELAILSTALALASMVWGMALISWKRQRTLHMPQWVLFAIVSILGVVGLTA